MTTQAESTGVDRQLGTPRVAASRRPDVIFGIANVFCTGAVVLCCRSQVSSRVDWPALVVGGALGSLATLAGIVYADSGIHSFFLGLAVLATCIVKGISTGKGAVETLLLSLSLSRALFLVTLLSRIPATKKWFRLIATGAILNPIMFVGFCGLPLVTLLTGSVILVLEDVQVEFPIVAPAMLAIATLSLCGLYYHNRSFKHGNLMIQAESRGIAVAAALAFAWTVQHAVGENVASVVLPILVGSAVTTLLSVVLCSVADVWDAVGSGQFQMVSLDTAAMLIYIVAPLLVLASLALDRYGETVSQAMSAIIKSQLGGSYVHNSKRPPEQPMTSGLFFLLALATMIGVPLINMLSPLGAYVISRAYTHGQPRTRRVALCIHFKDLLSESKEIKDESIQNLVNITKEKHILNIFVTAQELRLYPESIAELRSAQHVIGICSSTVEGISDAYNEYVQLLKMEPQWYHVGSQGGVSVGPDALKTAADLNLKVSFWSTHIAVGSREALLNVDLPNLCDDVSSTMGGNIIHLSDTWDDVESLVSAIDTIVQELGTNSEIKYSFAALSDVAMEDAAMKVGVTHTSTS